MKPTIKPQIFPLAGSRVMKRGPIHRKGREAFSSPPLAPYLIVVWGELVQQLLDSQLLSRTVDIRDLLLWEAAVVLVHLKDRRHTSPVQFPQRCVPMPKLWGEDALGEALPPGF